jgi:hypothetical protein
LSRRDSLSLCRRTEVRGLSYGVEEQRLKDTLTVRKEQMSRTLLLARGTEVEDTPTVERKEVEDTPTIEGKRGRGLLPL